MKVVFRSSFERDAKKSPPGIQQELAKIIELAIISGKVSEIPKIRKMTGYKNAYRIRIDDYRVGLFLENETIEFVRLLPRDKIYKKFP